MLIRSLCDYYDIQSARGEAASDIMSEQPVHWMVMLTPDGRVADIIDKRIEESVPQKNGKVKIVKKPIVVPLPKRTQKTGIDANIIEHRPLYIFGLNYDAKIGLTPDDKTGKARKSHEAFVKKNLEFFDGIDSEIARAYVNFIKNWVPENETENEQLKKLGITADNAYTCTCYLEQVGNTPKQGDILSWAESSAVVYANSVLGARCNRNSGMLELMGSIAGFVPEFGLLTDEGRKAHWLVEVKCTRRPEAQLLGSAIGMKVMEDVPYVRGLDKWLGTELNDENRAYLKDFGAATASNGAVGLYHVEHLTPEAKQQGEALLREGYRTYIIDDAELERVKRSYPVIWKDPAAAPQLCFVGCPHLTLEQLKDWTAKLTDALRAQNRLQVAVPTVFTAAPAVLDAFKDTVEGYKLQSMGVILSYICPLMYMNNPLCKKKAVITNSNKLRTYTSARYYTDAEILDILTGKEGR